MNLHVDLVELCFLSVQLVTTEYFEFPIPLPASQMLLVASDYLSNLRVLSSMYAVLGE